MNTVLLIVLQYRVDLQLDLLRQIVQFGGPRMTATDALHHNDGEASYDEHAAVVMTLRTDDGEWVVGIRHGRARRS